MQLRQAEPLGVLDQHHRRVGHVDADLDHRRRNEDLHLVVAERAHDHIALLGLHAPVDEPHTELREHLLQALGAGGRRLQVRALGHVDHRIDHVALPPRRALAAQERVDARPGGLGAQRRFHRAPPRRPLAQLGHVEVPVQRQRQRPRDRGRREEQDVRRVAFFGQGGALLHAETVLLVDHGKAEALEAHRLLDQRVRAHDEPRPAAGDALAGRRLFGAGQAPDQELGPEAHGLQQAREGVVVLLGEQLRRRHDRGLVAVLGGEQHREQRHHRLPGPHVAHQQAMHPLGGRHVFGDFPDGVLLVSRQLEGERLLEPRRQLAFELEADAGPRAFGQHPRPGLHELLVEEFVEGQAPPAALGVLERRGPVDRREGLPHRGEPHARAQRRRMRIRRERQQRVEVLGQQPADLAVGQPFGRRIHRQDHPVAGLVLVLLGEHDELARHKLAAVIEPDRTAHQQ